MQMSVDSKRVGERIRIAETLEVIVLDLAGPRVKLGIRAVGGMPHATPRVACSGPRCSPGYYHSDHGLAVLVVSATAGQHLKINDTVGLSVDGVDVNCVRLSISAVDNRIAPPRFTNRLQSRLSPARKENHDRNWFDARH